MSNAIDDLIQAKSAAKQQPMLTPEEETSAARRWREKGDRKARDLLVKSHMRLATKLAGKYARSRLPMGDLIAEGYVGLVKAVDRFDPSLGYRLSTYATWWIRAEIQTFLLKNWSLTSGGSTAALKKVFFNLRQLQRKLGIHDATMSDDDVERIAAALDVPVAAVREMEERFALNTVSLSRGFGEEDDTDMLDLLVVDDGPTIEDTIADSEQHRQRQRLLRDAIGTLDDRERRIVAARHLAEKPATLEDLSGKFGVSKERVRQLESRALARLTARVTAQAPRQIAA